MKAKILIVGDSITLGATEVRGREIVSHAPRSYVDCLRDLLPQARIDVDAVVLRTTAGLSSHVGRLLGADPADVLLLMLGGNDADLDWRRFVLSDGRVIRNNVALDAFTRNLNEIADVARAAGARIVLCDIPSHQIENRARWVGEQSGRDVVAMVQSGGGQATSDRQLAEYNRVVRETAAGQGCLLAAWAHVLDSLPKEEQHGPDHAHPSAAAHPLIAAALAPILARAAATSAALVRA